jgi:hypothetical protein
MLLIARYIDRKAFTTTDLGLLRVMLGLFVGANKAATLSAWALMRLFFGPNETVAANNSILSNREREWPGNPMINRGL